MKQTIIHELNTKYLKTPTRKVRVWLPEDYETKPDQRYPVLYMHDGQNVMDPSPMSGYSWNAKVILDDMVKQSITKPMILVGIDHGDDWRVSEYTLSAGPKGLKGMRHFHQDSIPMGGEYARFLFEIVKPLIDQTYRTLPGRESTAIAGSSCGGNISLQIYLKFPDIFSRVGIFSPALWLIQETLKQDIHSHSHQEARLYLDMGGKESKWFNFLNIRGVQKLHKALEYIGYTKQELKLVIDPKATHTELFWQSRFPEFIQWIRF